MAEINDTKSTFSPEVTGRGLMRRALEMERRMSLKSKKSVEPIVEQNGVFTIQENIETSAVKQDPYFKDLVESVLGIKQ